MADDLIFADAVDAAATILEALMPIIQAEVTTQTALAATMVNHHPTGQTIANRTSVATEQSALTPALAQLVALRAAEAAWRIANP